MNFSGVGVLEGTGTGTLIILDYVMPFVRGLMVVGNIPCWIIQLFPLAKAVKFSILLVFFCHGLLELF